MAMLSCGSRPVLGRRPDTQHHACSPATTSGRVLGGHGPHLRRIWTFSPRRRAPVRALGSEYGDQYALSPFALMDRQMQQMNEQMRAMDREFGEMEQMMRRDLQDTLQSSRRLAEQMSREAEQQLQRAREESSVTTYSRPNIQIERSEQKAPGSYRYYESIQIRTGYGVPYQTLATQDATLASGPSAAVLALSLILAGAWAAVTAIFHNNYDATTFKPEARWKLYAFWPFLLLFSSKFREQFVAAFQGRAPSPRQDGGEQGGSSG